jgi:hypothetical protein
MATANEVSPEEEAEKKRAKETFAQKLDEARDSYRQINGFNSPIDVWTLGAREMRNYSSEILSVFTQKPKKAPAGRVDAGTLFYIALHDQPVAGVVSVSDIDTLLALGNCKSIDGVIDVLNRWNRLGPNSTLVNSLKACRLDAQLGAQAGYGPKISEFAHHTPSFDQNGAARAVEFSDHVVAAGQLSLMGSPETTQSIYGFIERVDHNAKLALELPTGEVIDTFDEDGATLNLRRMLLAAPIALLDIRVRRIS